MNTNNLKKISYNAKYEYLLYIVLGLAICGFLLSSILLNRISADNPYLITFLILAATCSLIGIWGMIKRHSIKNDVLNTNSIQYKLFKQRNYGKFFIVSGLLRIVRILALLIIVFFLLVRFAEIPNNPESRLGYAIGFIIAMLIFIPISGFIEYYKYKTMQFIDD